MSMVKNANLVAMSIWYIHPIIHRSLVLLLLEGRWKLILGVSVSLSAPIMFSFLQWYDMGFVQAVEALMYSLTMAERHWQQLILIVDILLRHLKFEQLAKHWDLVILMVLITVILPECLSTNSCSCYYTELLLSVTTLICTLVFLNFDDIWYIWNMLIWCLFLISCVGAGLSLVLLHPTNIV